MKKLSDLMPMNEVKLTILALDYARQVGMDELLDTATSIANMYNLDGPELLEHIEGTDPALAGEIVSALDFVGGE
jgi:hypothetical protein